MQLDHLHLGAGLLLLLLLLLCSSSCSSSGGTSLLCLLLHGCNCEQLLVMLLLLLLGGERHLHLAHLVRLLGFLMRTQDHSLLSWSEVGKVGEGHLQLRILNWLSSLYNHYGMLLLNDGRPLSRSLLLLLLQLQLQLLLLLLLLQLLQLELSMLLLLLLLVLLQQLQMMLLLLLLFTQLRFGCSIELLLHLLSCSCCRWIGTSSVRLSLHGGLLRAQIGKQRGLLVLGWRLGLRRTRIGRRGCDDIGNHLEAGAHVSRRVTSQRSHHRLQHILIMTDVPECLTKRLQGFGSDRVVRVGLAERSRDEDVSGSLAVGRRHVGPVIVVLHDGCSRAGRGQ